ncbi:MAG: hypothetical protein M4D80_23145 [Myxococcota bacterium]|nr:hypothetical protein [Deltaproteobacteria bacterium]MDQ3338072.1 hypothetical protein [Myxococcota bacterium]
MRKLAVLALIAGCYTGKAPPAPVTAPVEAVSRHARTAADPLGFLPIDADLVMSLDTVSLRRTALWNRIEPTLMTKAGPTLEQFKAACGFDPVPQIEHVTVGLKHVSTVQREGVIVVGGLARSQLMGCMTRAIRQTPTLARIERNVVLLTAAPGEKPVAFAFADARTLVILAGEKAATAQGLRDILDAGAPLRSSEMFMEMFGRLDVRRHAWFFVNESSKLFDSIGSLGVHPRAVFGGIDMPAGATAKLYVRMPNAGEASTLVTMLKSQLAAVQSLVEKFEVEAEDVDVVVDIVLTEDQMMLGASLLGP